MLHFAVENDNIIMVKFLLSLDNIDITIPYVIYELNILMKL